MKYVKLYECAKFSNKRTKDINIESYISTENMLPYKGGITIAESLPDCQSASKYEPYDILLSNIRPYFQKIWYADRIGSCSNDVLVLKSNGKVDSKFLYYILSDKTFFDYDTLTSKGTKMPRGTKNAIMKYIVPDVALPIQHKIASILSAYDSLIENNAKRIRLLEQVAENLYKEWFVRFRFPGYENAEFVNGLPKGWATLQIKDMTSLKSGFAFKSEWFTENGYAVAKIKDIGNIIMDTSDFSYVYHENCKKAERFKLIEGDLTIALTGATIGKISIVPQYHKPLYTNQRLGKFFNGTKPIEKTPFLYCLFSQTSMNKSIINLANSSSAQPNISPEQIERIKFVGNIEFINLFNQTTKSMFKEILRLHDQSALLSRQRDSLLPRLMSGKLEVKA